VLGNSPWPCLKKAPDAGAGEPALRWKQVSCGCSSQRARSHADLPRQLIDRVATPKPFIEIGGPLRYLHFDLDNVQSVMRLDDPQTRCAASTPQS